MIGRVVWFAAGVGVGVAATRRIAQSSSGTAVGAAASGIASRVRHVVDEVIADGRIEMRQREARLREVLAAPRQDATGIRGVRR